MGTIPIPIQTELKKICWSCLGDADVYAIQRLTADGMVDAGNSIKSCKTCSRHWR